MLHKSKAQNSYLITTPDYPPKVGGLTTFTCQLEKVFQSLGWEYDLLVWGSVNELRRYASKEKGRNYKKVFHVHFIGHHYLKHWSKSHINFIHGSEILFTSPHPLKKWYKKILKPIFLKTLESSQWNVFISQYTQDKLYEQGLKVNVKRDLVFHNAIETSHEYFVKKDMNDAVLRLIAVGRDVPHKNLESALSVAECMQSIHQKPVELYVTKRGVQSARIKVRDISGSSNKELEEYYRQSHFNLLLSLDHSKNGFYEGFGLTILEAGLFGTPSLVTKSGGQREAVHHGVTGWILPAHQSHWFHFLKNITNEVYLPVAREVHRHTLHSHTLSLYQRLLGLL